MNQKLKNFNFEIFNRYSEFYRKVWLETSKIPKGKVLTYKQLAKKVGFPKAYRAVGNALNKNPFAPIIPCHRVIKSDYTLGGYSAGINKKIKLLLKEGVKLRRIGKKIKVEI